jgi:hypothetical protein
MSVMVNCTSHTNDAHAGETEMRLSQRKSISETISRELSGADKQKGDI